MKIIPEHIAGVDEVGRGPLAGPVVAAAVILDPARPLPDGIRDSKQLSPIQRARWVDIIHTHALSWQIGMADAAEIDQLNILQASLLAMQRAVMGLTVLPTAVWVDGQHCPNVPYPCRAIVRGDATVPAISAAAILAKEVRDSMMCSLDTEYPQYGFARHKGYPTAMHREALHRYGPCPLHRQSFAPVKAAWQPLHLRTHLL